MPTGLGRVYALRALRPPWAVPGRQISFCTPLHASDIILEREYYLRDTSDDLFISELWRLLDDYEIIKPQAFLFTQWPGVKN